VEPERADALVGRLLDGRYRIGPRIARGGMASVYEATDIRLDRTVAVKVMHAGLGDDDEFAARFVREARAAARLSHPNVVNVFDQGDEDGTVFLAMEYVPGHTLRDVIRKEAPMAPVRALALLEPVVSALAAAHRAGLMHRDVKPENVLIADEQYGGRVKVADFGLARAVSADTQHTATGGVLIGTVSYLAPELVVDGRADARADVYAVGVVLFELLTGTKPHEGESPIQVAWKHVHEDVPAPSRLQPGIPAYVDALVARATARDRSQRPADAAVLLHQLHRVANALATGVVDDDELTEDLMPRPVPELTRELDELSGQVAAPVVGRADGQAAEEDHHPTTTIDRPPATGTPPARPPVRRTPVPVAAPARPRRSRRGPLALVLSLLLVAGLGVGAWWFGFARYTSMPGVLGLEEAAAVDRLERAGLSAEAGDPAYSETVPKGEVITSDPEPGDRVLEGDTVTLVLSLGKERYDVPRLRGMTEDEAQDALTQTNLAFGDSTGRWSETVPEGVVIASDPERGTRLRPDAAVDLVISKGRRPIEVRDFTGEPLERVEAWAEKKGLDAQVVGEEYSDSVPEGRIIAQSPSSGQLYKGDAVDLVVSQGPELVEVPRVVAMGVDAATDRLEQLGFEVRVENDDNYIGVGFVFRSDPSAGSMAPKGSVVTLYLI
jgi:eukaryotic-like serine/threonine-protein kinase